MKTDCLSLHGLTRTFGATLAVDDVTLSIPQGQFVGVIGPSGAGKSTLLRLMNRLIDPTAGSVHFGATNVTALRGKALRQWRRDCAMIFQQFNLVERMDVLTNVLIGRLSDHSFLSSMMKRFSEEERAEAILALERLGLAHKALERAGNLSGGQQQRAAIARALVQKPRILLADEPIASLDPGNATRVMEALRRINREDGITVIVNLHTLDTARTYCDRIVAMQAGRVMFDGSPRPLSLFGAKNINRLPVLRFSVRRGFDVIRAFETLILALIFIRAFGLGPLAGVLAIAIGEIGVLGKLYAEAIENTSKKPVDGVMAAGGSWLQSIHFGVMPQAIPVILSITLYNFESNVRSSTILGIVGAGGIGFLLSDRIRAYRWDEAWSIIILIIVMVYIIDAISAAIRMRIIGTGPARRPVH